MKKFYSLTHGSFWWILLWYVAPALAQSPAASGADSPVRLKELSQKVSALPEKTTPQKLKKAALRLALEQAGNGLEAAQTDDANALGAK